MFHLPFGRSSSQQLLTPYLHIQDTKYMMPIYAHAHNIQHYYKSLPPTQPSKIEPRIVNNPYITLLSVSKKKGKKTYLQNMNMKYMIY